MSSKVEYRGGIPELRKAGTSVVSAAISGFTVCGTGFTTKKYKILYEDMIDVSLVAEGAKKQNYVLSVEYAVDGFKTTAVFSGKETSDVYGKIQKYRKNVKPKQATNEPSVPGIPSQIDVAEEISKYFDLKEKGILSEEEFEAKKAQLLGL